MLGQRSLKLIFVLSGVALVLSGVLATPGHNEHDMVTEVLRTFRTCKSTLKNSDTKKAYLVDRSTRTSRKADWYITGGKNEVIQTFNDANVYLTSNGGLYARESFYGKNKNQEGEVQYCYRSDGSIAFVYRELRSTDQQVRVQSRLYFNERGKLFHRIDSLFDLEVSGTGKEKELRNESLPLYGTKSDYIERFRLAELKKILSK